MSSTKNTARSELVEKSPEVKVSTALLAQA